METHSNLISRIKKLKESLFVNVVFVEVPPFVIGSVTDLHNHQRLESHGSKIDLYITMNDTKERILEKVEKAELGLIEKLKLIEHRKSSPELFENLVYNVLY